MSALVLENISKSYSQGDQRIEVLKNFSLEVKNNQIVSIVGPSGSGKTTVIQIAALLDIPDSGKVIIDGFDYSTSSDNERTEARSKKIGFVYQFHNLLSDFTVIENIIMPLIVNGINHNDAKEQAMQYIQKLGLEHRINNFGSQLSGGERQRVAVARALIHKPKIIFADEPTGNLDPKTAEIVFHLIIESIKENGSSAVIVTHNMEFAKCTDTSLVF